MFRFLLPWLLPLAAGSCFVASIGCSDAGSAQAGPSGAAAPAQSSSGVVSAPAVANLTFVRNGKTVATVQLAELVKAVEPVEVSVFDPYYQKPKRFRAIPLMLVLERGFGDADSAEGSLSEQEYLFKALDGYAVPMSGALVFEPGAYLAFEDLEVPGWEPIGPKKANPGPFYLIWTEASQQSIETHPRPWQLATIEIAKFADAFPHVGPDGTPKEDPAWRGLSLFRKNCIKCHAINREGGRVGPDLNVPQSIVEYRPPEQIRDYIRNPMTFRYGSMPAHPHIDDGGLNDLLAYFEAMKSKKHDPDATKAAAAKSEDE